MGLKDGSDVPKEMEEFYKMKRLGAKFNETFLMEEKQKGEAGYFVTYCPVVCQTQAKYNTHTRKVHDLHVEEFYIESPGTVVKTEDTEKNDDYKMTIVKSLLSSQAQQQYGNNRPRKLPEKPSTRESTHWIAEWLLYWQRYALIDAHGTIKKVH
jgi:hypothetical protein